MRVWQQQQHIISALSRTTSRVFFYTCAYVWKNMENFRHCLHISSYLCLCVSLTRTFLIASAFIPRMRGMCCGRQTHRVEMIDSLSRSRSRCLFLSPSLFCGLLPRWLTHIFTHPLLVCSFSPKKTSTTFATTTIIMSEFIVDNMPPERTRPRSLA